MGISYYQMMGIALFLLLMIFGVSGLLLSVLTSGDSLARILRDYRNVLEFKEAIDYFTVGRKEKGEFQSE